MKILMSSYSCAPRGSEPRTGWEWVVSMANRGHEVTALVNSRYRPEIEAAATPENLNFVYITPSPLAIRLGSMAQYLSWQAKALPVARRLGHFDLVHHVSWGSLQGGSQLWRLGRPFILGPVGGGQTLPQVLYPALNGSKRKEQLRTLAARLIPWFPPSRAMAQHAKVIVAVNRDTGELAKRMGGRRIEYMADTPVGPALLHEPEPRPAGTDRPYQVLWVGRLLPRKAVLLAVDVMEKLGEEYHLTIYGDGPDGQALRERLQHSPARNRIDWKGQKPWNEVMEAYRHSDVLLFTSLRESLGSQVMEAQANGLPVVTLNQHGVAEHLPDTAAIKVTVSDPATVALALARSIQWLREHPEEHTRMAKAAFENAQTHLQENRAERMEQFYLEALR